MTNFKEKSRNYVKRLTITFLTLHMNWIFITRERMSPITWKLTSPMSVVNNHSSPVFD